MEWQTPDEREQMRMDLVDQIVAYEQDGLADEDVVALFQTLVNTGLAWTLQGSYGRTAKAMIDAGLVTEPTTEKSRA